MLAPAEVRTATEALQLADRGRLVQPLGPGGAEPVRQPGVELGRLAGLQSMWTAVGIGAGVAMGAQMILANAYHLT